MNQLTNEEVKHVADLARLEVKEEQLESYGTQLYDILSEIEKINQVELDEEGPIMISPTTNQNCWSEDQVEPMLTHEEIMKNVPHKTERYIVVPEVLHDELS